MSGERPPLAESGEIFPVGGKQRLGGKIAFVQSMHGSVLRTHAAGRAAQASPGFNDLSAGQRDNAVFEDPRCQAALEIEKMDRLIGPAHAKVMAHGMPGKHGKKPALIFVSFGGFVVNIPP